MNNLRNSVQLIGNLGADTETITTASGKAMARARIATSDTYRNKSGEKVTSVQWHTLVAFGKQAETLSTYGKKGKELAITGKLRYDSYTGKDGNKRYSTEVIVQEFLLLR